MPSSTKGVHLAVKRAVAREAIAALTGRCAVPDYTHLPPATRENIALIAGATALSGGQRVGEIEIGCCRSEFTTSDQASRDAAIHL